MTRWGLVTDCAPDGKARWLIDPRQAHLAAGVVCVKSDPADALTFDSMELAAAVARLLPASFELVPVEIPQTLAERQIDEVLSAAADSYAGVRFMCPVSANARHGWRIMPLPPGSGFIFYCEWCAAHIDKDSFRDWGLAITAWADQQD